jgi:hypothetical protein
MPTPSEFEIQRAFRIYYKGDKWLKGPRKGEWKVLPAKLPGVVAWHTPNGGSREGGAFEGMRLNEIGQEAGIPDFLFLWGGLYALEFKQPKPNKTALEQLSDSQQRMIPLLEAAGLVAWAAVDNLADAIAFVRRYGLVQPGL